jgi:hypothetical protein
MHPEAQVFVPVNEAVPPLTDPAVIGAVSEGSALSWQDDVTPVRESPMMA